MVKKILIISTLIFSLLEASCQVKKNPTPEYVISSVTDSVLKSEIKEFIKETSFYLDNNDKRKIAISVSIIFLPNEEIPSKAIPVEIPNSNSVLYIIKYVNEFYRLTRVKSISKLDDMVIIFNMIPLITSIKKETWLNFIKDRFPSEYNYFLNNEEWPLDLTLYHQIPTWYISVKDGKIFDKKTLFE